MFSRLPKELKRLKKQDITLNEVLHYYDDSSNMKNKRKAKNIWMEKRNKKRQESGLEPEDKENLEAAFNRNLKRLNEKKQEIKKEEEFQRKKKKYTKAYEQKQRDDLKQGKGIRYSNSKAWEYKKNKNNKTRKKSPLSQVHHTPTDAFTPEEREKLTQLSIQQMDKESESKNADWGKISGGKRRKKRKTRKKRKKKTRKTRKRNKRFRRRRKTRRKRAGNKILQNELNKGTDGCYTLHPMTQVTKCINQGGLDKYNKKHKSNYQKSHILSTPTYNN